MAVLVNASNPGIDDLPFDYPRALRRECRSAFPDLFVFFYQPTNIVSQIYHFLACRSPIEHPIRQPKSRRQLHARAPGQPKRIERIHPVTRCTHAPGRRSTGISDKH